MKAIVCLTVLFLASCAEWAGNGISVSARYENPETGVVVEAQTAK